MEGRVSQPMLMGDGWLIVLPKWKRIYVDQRSDYTHQHSATSSGSSARRLLAIPKKERRINQHRASVCPKLNRLYSSTQRNQPRSVGFLSFQRSGAESINTEQQQPASSGSAAGQIVVEVLVLSILSFFNGYWWFHIDRLKAIDFENSFFQEALAAIIIV